MGRIGRGLYSPPSPVLVLEAQFPSPEHKNPAAYLEPWSEPIRMASDNTQCSQGKPSGPGPPYGSH